MAKEKDNARSRSMFRRINRNLDTLDLSMDSLYQSTYSSRTDNKRDMDNIVTSIDDTIDNIINSGTGPKVSDISNLYIRLQQKQGVSNTGIVNSVMELFSDNTIISSLSINQDINRGILAENYQYDMICKYMPSIQTALDIKKDNVLSADNFTKDFLNVVGDSLSKDKASVFNDRTRTCMDKYHFQDLCEEAYEKMVKYGECFIYCVPYSVALERLLHRKNQFASAGIVRTFSESGEETQPKLNQRSTVLFESSNMDAELSSQLKEAKTKLDDMENCKINLIFNDGCIIREAVEEKKRALEIAEKGRSISLCENYSILQEATKEGKEVASVQFDSMWKGMKKGSDTLDGGINDGLVINGGVKKYNGSDEKVDDLSGAVVEFLDREDILPIYMDTLCVGYYMFSYSYEDDLNTCRHGYMGDTMSTVGTSNIHNTNDIANDMLLAYISQKMSNNIDSHFINANKDLKEEIYSILKFNDKFAILNGTNNITVTFLPADDVVHCFLKQDRRTHRGISAIEKSVVPAMMYCLLYLTNTIGQVTRAQDKRVYYVKQNVETNVARTMMNVVNQIKKGNMGMRQIQSMNSILNIVGRYNDYIIPVGQSGDAPIDFQVMEGQKIETPTELMDRFENEAIASTDVPYEFVQSVNQVDYATRFTMSNSKFLRSVYKEQRICQDLFSRIFTKIYNYEYNEAERQIKILLPAPAFLSMTNTQQLIDNTRNFVNAIAETELAGAKDEVKNEFIKTMTREYLGSYIDYSKVDAAIQKAKLITSVKEEDEE